MKPSTCTRMSSPCHERTISTLRNFGILQQVCVLPNPRIRIGSGSGSLPSLASPENLTPLRIKTRTKAAFDLLLNEDKGSLGQGEFFSFIVA